MNQSKLKKTVISEVAVRPPLSSREKEKNLLMRVPPRSLRRLRIQSPHLNPPLTALRLINPLKNPLNQRGLERQR